MQNCPTLNSLGYRLVDHAQSKILYHPASGIGRKMTPNHLLDLYAEAPPFAEILKLSEVNVEVAAGAYPTTVCWSPIVSCNLFCEYCLDDKTLSSRGVDNRLSIARVLCNSAVRCIDISGGEPLLLPELPRLLSTLRSAEKALSITTNGWFLEEKLNSISPFLDGIRVSLDSHRNVEHDQIRGEGSYERAVQGILQAVKMEIPTQLQFVVRPSNVYQLDDIVRFSCELGCSGITFLQMLPIGEAQGSTEDDLVSDGLLEDNTKAFSQMRDYFEIRTRYRKEVSDFTVVRADGKVYRNSFGGMSIQPIGLLTEPSILRYHG